jgi:hypothetical protein
MILSRYSAGETVNPWKPSVSIANVPAEIRTWHFSDTNQKSCCLSQLAESSLRFSGMWRRIVWYLSTTCKTPQPRRQCLSLKVYIYFDIPNYGPVFTNFLALVGFEVLTAVVMKSTIFWDITPCSLLSLQSRKQLASKDTCFHAGFLLSIFFQPWRWRPYVPLKRRLTLDGLHGVISQKMVLFLALMCVYSYTYIYIYTSINTVYINVLQAYIIDNVCIKSIHVIWSICTNFSIYVQIYLLPSNLELEH